MSISATKSCVRSCILRLRDFSFINATVQFINISLFFRYSAIFLLFFYQIKIPSDGSTNIWSIYIVNSLLHTFLTLGRRTSFTPFFIFFFKQNELEEFRKITGTNNCQLKIVWKQKEFLFENLGRYKTATVLRELKRSACVYPWFPAQKWCFLGRMHSGHAEDAFIDRFPNCST